MTEVTRPRLVIYSVVILVIAFLACEIVAQVAFRLKYREPPQVFGKRTFAQVERYMSDHPYLPYIATEGRAYVNKDSWGTTAPVTFNSLGDRGPEPDVPKRRVRIIAFGGSTTFGAPSPLDETWPWLLQKYLGDDRFEVINAAQNGATTADTLVNLALIHIDLEPDYIVIYHGTNDLESSFAPGFKADYSHRRRKIASVPPIFETLPRALDYSAQFVLLRNAILGNRAYGDLWSRYTRNTDYDFERGPFGLATFQRNLKNIIAIANANGAHVVVGTFQYHKQWAADNVSPEFADAWERGLAQQNQIVRQLADSDYDVMVTDVANFFQPTSETLWDFCHLTARGNSKVAEAFAETISRHIEVQNAGDRVAINSGPLGPSASPPAR